MLNLILNQTLIFIGFFDSSKILTSNKYINYTHNNTPVLIINKTYSVNKTDKFGFKSTTEKGYYLHVYKDKDNYFFVKSKEKKFKKFYFGEMLFSSKYLDQIYKQLENQSINQLTSQQIIQNLNYIGFEEVDDGWKVKKTYLFQDIINYDKRYLDKEKKEFQILKSKYLNHSKTNRLTIDEAIKKIDNSKMEAKEKLNKDAFNE
jgi:hypothetical protein